MGILDKLIKLVTGGGKDSRPQQSKPTAANRQTAPAPNRQPAPAPSRQAAPAVSDLAETKARFDAILAEEFSGYEVLENVPVVEVNTAEAGSRPYTYVLFRDNRPCVAVMLTSRGESYKNRAFIGAKKACELSGIAFLNFFTFFANERGYVVNRIKDAIKG